MPGMAIPAGAGDLLQLSAERGPAAEAGHPRDAGVVELGRALSRSASSVSRAVHTCGPHGCSTAALASSSGIESTRQPPDL
jgi:hypothetical protein